jgi:hypothetical protein
MKILSTGDKGKGICHKCGLVETTFRYRDVLLKKSKKIIPNILVGVCDNCGDTISTPAQSTEAIKMVRDNNN